jgi:hypothetical protein
MIPRITLTEIEKFAGTFARDNQAVCDLVAGLNAELDQVKHRHLPRLRAAVELARTSKGLLHAAVEQSAPLFVRPRTQVFHGIKIGFAKGKGRLEITDEAATIGKIHHWFGADAGAFLRTTVAPDKETLARLSAADLKKLGITLTDTTDTVVIKPLAGELDKTVAALLKEPATDAN